MFFTFFFVGNTDKNGYNSVAKGELTVRTSASTINLCNLPPWVIGSPDFNGNPRPIEIQGVRRAHRFFFSRVAKMDSIDDRARSFRDYMDVAFQLHQWQREESPLSRKSLRNS